MKRHAYLIMAHNEFHMLKKLINELDDERNDIYIHIDRKTKRVDKGEITSWAKKSGIFFIHRINIYWGTLSIVKCELLLLEAAIKNGYQYYHLLSGVDFPLKDQNTIHQYFENEDREYISCHLDGENGDHYLYKIRYYYPLLRFVGKGQFEGPGRKKAFMRWLLRQQWKFLEYQQKHNVDRTGKNEGITFYKGDQWFSITYEFAKYVVSQKKQIIDLYRFTNTPDEFFIPTLAMNSRFAERVNNCSLRKIDWKRGEPYTFTEEDYDELIDSDAFFARKISYDEHPLLVNRIRAELHHQIKADARPLVSVIVPCYNVEKYLPECLDSLIYQTYTNIEILIIDDGSRDDTSAVAKDYADKYECVHYYYKDNGGLSSARNMGIEYASGDYLAFVDSDDWVDEDYIEKLYKAMTDNYADIAACGYVEEGDASGRVSFERKMVLSPYKAMKILGDIYPDENVLLVLACNKLFKRKAFDTIRFPEGRIHEDEFIAHRIIAQADSIAVIPDCLYHYRIREDSISGSKASQSPGHMRFLDALQDRLECSDVMMYRPLYIYMLYTYFEGIKRLMVRYSDDSVRKYRLLAFFRSKALEMYVRHFFELDSYQKRTYLQLILHTGKFRQVVIEDWNK